jgi:hypothetical protein
MAATKAKEGRDIQRYGCNLESGTLQPGYVLKRSELQLLLHDPVSCFPAADILMLVTAAHMGEAPLFESIKCHGGGIMEAGKKISGLVRKALPALEPECLSAQIQRPAMDKEHPAVNQFHRHGIKDGKERGIPQLLVAVSACSIAPAHEETMEVGMVMVPENRYKPVLLGHSMDLLKSFLGPVTSVKEIAKINQDINRAKLFTKQRGLNACCKCTDCY